MGEVLFELEQVLRSKQHKLTLQESNAILNCKSKALKDYAVGAIVGAGVSWIATSKLSLFGRISISAGASAFVGLWRLGSSLESCVDHILALEESRMQRELANIVVTKYRHDPWRMQHISKHFYSEEVFDDSTSDQPKIRWRYRNFFSDNTDDNQRTHESNSHSEYQGDSPSNSHGDNNSNTQTSSRDTRTNTRMESERTKFNSQSNQALMSAAIDTMDPIDCFFGYPMMEEIHHHDPSTAPPRVHARKDRRAHRRRRLHHQDVLLSPQPA